MAKCIRVVSKNRKNASQDGSTNGVARIRMRRRRLWLRLLITQTPNFIPVCYVALVTLLTYSVYTCTAARSFSSMKRLKSPLRSTMRDERLSSLAILHIHKHKNVDIDRLVTEFARLKGRRLALCLLPVYIAFVFFFFLEHCSLQKSLGKRLK